jgi:IS605 OrfB family transposase
MRPVPDLPTQRRARPLQSLERPVLCRSPGPRLHIPNLGWVRMREVLRIQGKLMSATVSRVADRWFVSLTVEVHGPTSSPAKNQGVVGVDLGVTTPATLSTGERVTGPKPHKALLGRLRRLSRGLSRRVKGSANRKKARAKLARLHARIGNIRRDALHQLTSDLTSRFHTIGIEDLNVHGMVKNGHLARSISDMGFNELRRQLQYKAAQRSSVVHVADRWYPISKLCSECGAQNEALTLRDRNWTCVCGATHDRDVHAAINLRDLAVRSTVSVCEEEGAGSGRRTGVKRASAKQKVSFEHVLAGSSTYDGTTSHARSGPTLGTNGTLSTHAQGLRAITRRPQRIAPWTFAILMLLKMLLLIAAEGLARTLNRSQLTKYRHPNGRWQFAIQDWKNLVN